MEVPGGITEFKRDFIKSERKIGSISERNPLELHTAP